MGRSAVMLIAVMLIAALAIAAFFVAPGARGRIRRVYRLLVPAAIRRRREARTRGDRRQQQEDQWRQHELAFPEFHDGRVVLTVRKRPVVGTIAPHRLDWVGARRANMRSVLGAFEAAGLDHFAIRCADPRKSAVAVRDTDRADVARVLSDLLGSTGGYAQVLKRDRGGITPPMAGTSPLELTDHSDSVVRVFWYRRNVEGARTFGARYACDIEFWSEAADGLLIPPRRNPVIDQVSADSARSFVPDSTLLPYVPHPEPREAFPVLTVAPFNGRIVGDVMFPIDVVFTWVDGEDPEWQRRKAEHAPPEYHEDAGGSSRFMSRDELRYALRSIEMFAPWVRNIFLVTDRQVPEWLNPDATGLRVVDHTEIFTDPEALPTFNSHAIESQLHHIDGLSEHFLYLNDDVMFGSDVLPQVFFEANGLTRFFPSRYPVPPGPVTAEDPPVVAAGKNNRDALSELLGAQVVRRMKHVPHAARRSVLYEIEERFSDLHRATARSQMRSTTDLSILSSFYHYYAYAKGLSVPGRIRYRYVDLGKPDAEERLAEIRRDRAYEAICLNTGGSGYGISADVFDAFLTKYFNTPSRFEG